MATSQLFLDIFAFNLQKIKSSHNIVTPSGSSSTRHKTLKENLSFDSFFGKLNGNSVDEKFQSFINEFVGNFNLQYTVKRDKGISMNPNQTIGIKSKTFVIWGEFSGGHTGREQQVFNQKDSTSSEYTISKEKMVVSPFFFLLWIPKDSNMGILMIQRYSNMSCSTEFRNALAKFFIDKGFKPIWAAFIPKEVCKEYLENCYLTAFDVVHAAPKQENFKDTVFESFASEKGVSFKTKLSGICLSFAKLLKTGKFVEDFKGFIGKIDQNYNEGDDVTICYKNSDGITASAKLINYKDIMPKISLESDCFDVDTNTPNWDKISDTAIKFLESIKKEIGYTKELE